MKKLKILNNTRVNHIIRRIAYQIYESNESEKEIVLVGIFPNGDLLAKKIIAVLKKISPLRITYIKLTIDKNNVFNEIITSVPLAEIKNKSVVIVDDVLNTGRTLAYTMKYLLNQSVSQIKISVLVNRSHKRFSVKADFKGISLSTSMQEHVSVELNNKKMEVFLS